MKNDFKVSKVQKKYPKFNFTSAADAGYSQADHELRQTFKEIISGENKLRSNASEASTVRFQNYYETAHAGAPRWAT